MPGTTNTALCMVQQRTTAISLGRGKAFGYVCGAGGLFLANTRQASSFTRHRSCFSNALRASTMSRSITQRLSLPGVHNSRSGRQNTPEARTRRARWRAASAATR